MCALPVHMFQRHKYETHIIEYVIKNIIKKNRKIFTRSVHRDICEIIFHLMSHFLVGFWGWVYMAKL